MVLSQDILKSIKIDAAQAASLNREELTDLVVAQIADQAGIQIPQDVVEQEADVLLRGYSSQRRYQGMASGHYMDVLLELQRDWQQLSDHFQAQAAAELRAEQVIQSIIESEHLSVTREELLDEAVKMARRQNVPIDEVKQFFGEDLQLLERDVLQKKARDFILNCAAVQPET